MKTVSKKLLSLLLVAMLLVSAVPFQAFAEAHDAGTHQLSSDFQSNATDHWQVCLTPDCTPTDGEYNKTAHNFVAVAGSAQTETCGTDGKEADQKCSDCNYTKTGASIPATGNHNDANHDSKCDTCGASMDAPHVDANNDGKCDVCGVTMPTVQQTFEVTVTITGDNGMSYTINDSITATKKTSDSTYTLNSTNDYFQLSTDNKSVQYNAKAAAKNKLTDEGKTQYVELVDKNNVSENVALNVGANTISVSVACSGHVYNTNNTCKYCGYQLPSNSSNMSFTTTVIIKNESGRYLSSSTGTTMTVSYDGTNVSGTNSTYFTKANGIQANELVFDAAAYAKAVLGTTDSNGATYVVKRAYNNRTYDETSENPKPTVLANSTNTITIIVGYSVSSYNVQLVLKGGIVNNATPATLNYTVTYGGEQLTLPTVTSPKSELNFKGWSKDPNGAIYLSNGALVPEQTSNLTLYAIFETQKATLNVTFVDAKGNYMNQVQYACDFNQTIDSVLTSNRRTEIQTRVMNDHPGYTWDGYFYTGRTGSNGVTMGQTLENISQVFIHLKARTYTLALNLNGGTYNGKSSIDNKTNIADGTSVSLPIPRYATADKVFTGWKDSVTNQVYTVGTDGKINMTVHSDTDRSTITLIAQWGDQAKVLLKIFANNELYSSDICIDVTNLLSGNTLYKTVVDKIVQARYTSNGGTMTISNLYDASAWNQYTANKKSNSGVEAITVGNSSSGNVVYVMVNNAKMSNQAVNVNNNTGNPNLIGNAYPTSTTPYDRSNPKTGDESYIGTAAVVMMVSAAALAGAWYFYKKKDLI